MRRLLLVSIISLVVGWISGIWVYHFQKPPYNQIKAAYRLFLQKPSYPEYSDIAEDFWRENVDNMISIKDSSDVYSKRRQLIEYIWKGAGFPTSHSFSQIENSVQDSRYEDLGNLQTIDKYTVSMDYGVNSVIYHFKPVKSNNKLAIYHQGHFGDFYLGKETIRFFLEKNFSVLAFAMPLNGMNSTPVVDLGSLGKVRFTSHDYFAYLDSPTFSSMRFFLEPVAIALNYVEEHYEYDSISMMGVSGGGTTTILYAALDPRVSRSYPVNTAGLPIFLRVVVGHYERSLPDFFRIANWLELYVMGSFGDGRKQLHIWNKDDPKGHYATRSHAYRSKTKAVVRELGKGDFDVYLDPENMTHIIGERARQVILDDIMGKGRSI